MRSRRARGSLPAWYSHTGVLEHVSINQPVARLVVPGAVKPDGQGACRDVADRHGKKWRVREMEMSEGAGSGTRRSLIALNEMVIRRFWTFPAAWQELSDLALLDLIDGPAQPHPDQKNIHD